MHLDLPSGRICDEASKVPAVAAAAQRRLTFLAERSGQRSKSARGEVLGILDPRLPQLVTISSGIPTYNSGTAPIHRLRAAEPTDTGRSGVSGHCKGRNLAEELGPQQSSGRTVMPERTTRAFATFLQPFSLVDVDGLQPAGTYLIETVEQTLDDLSFVARHVGLGVGFVMSASLSGGRQAGLIIPIPGGFQIIGIDGDTCLRSVAVPSAGRVIVVEMRR